jgi:adenosylcobinamide kinase/adenosylcobinamide-phosphate guanylyltransferase
MVLVTGGAYQGKLQYVLELTGLSQADTADCESCRTESIYSAKILDNFQMLIKRILSEKKDMSKILEQLVHENPDVIIIVDEVGCGVVPVDSFERLYRETVGRVSCTLAGKAKEVHRVVCGIGTVIKSD